MIFLNVGGWYFVTSIETMRKSDVLASLVTEDTIEVFIDRDPTHFRHILNWLRGIRYVPNDTATVRELLWEAEHYNLKEMMETLVHSEKVSIPHTLKGIQEELSKRRK